MSKEETKKDYLDVDSRIEGQSYVCLSFLSPEKLIQQKDAFYVSKFLQSVCKEKGWEFNAIYEKFKDFTYKYSSELQRDFDEENKFQTNMRGLKIRGCYSTKDEADARAKKLSNIDSTHNVFIGEVGHWLPWDPCADKVQSEVFQNTELNALMEKYNENEINKDIFYEEQKREKVKAARDEVAEAKKKELENAKKNGGDKKKVSTNYEVDGIDEVMNKVTEDVKTDVSDVSTVVEDVSTVVEDVSKTASDIKDAVKVVEEVVENEVTTLNTDIKRSLDKMDPWLERKLKLKEEATNDPDPDPEPEPEPDPEPEPEPETESKNC